MKYLVLIILFSTFLSCNSKYDEYNEYDDMHNMLCGEIEYDISYLKTKVDDKLKLLISDSTNSKKAKAFHKLVSKYTEYLSQLEWQFEEANENLFFNNDGISEIGTDYFDKTKMFGDELLELIDEDSFKKRVKFGLSTRTVQNRNGEEITYVDYHFKGIRRSGTLVFLKYKRREILDFEYKYLSDLICRL
jgi:hypothetical protein